MTRELLHFLRCPVTKSTLNLQVICTGKKLYDNQEIEIVTHGILYAQEDWVYPVVDGIPRLLIESVIDHGDFLKKYLPDYSSKVEILQNKYASLLKNTIKKNSKTKKSFEKEWRLFDYDKDKTWNADENEMIERFLKETKETKSSLYSKNILDAGCGNGLLDKLLAEQGAKIIGMDISKSIEQAFNRNNSANAYFIQGDVQFPPLIESFFDIVHCSGVLIHTNNTRLSFYSMESFVKKNGKLSVWLYHPRKDAIHKMILKVRGFTSKLPITIQYYLYLFIFYPPLYLIKLFKRQKPRKNELMVSLMDQFSPEFRWEHEPEEVKEWFNKKNYRDVEITTVDTFGFNITGIKN